VTVDFLIEPDGAVSVVMAEGEMVYGAVAQCVGSWFEKLRFPKPTKRVQVSYPVVFYPGG